MVILGIVEPVVNWTKQSPVKFVPLRVNDAMLLQL